MRQRGELRGAVVPPVTGVQARATAGDGVQDSGAAVDGRSSLRLPDASASSLDHSVHMEAMRRLL